MTDDKTLFGDQTERIQKVCSNCRISFDRACNAYRYLMSQESFARQGRMAIIDFLESRIKMVSFGAFPTLPGEEKE